MGRVSVMMLLAAAFAAAGTAAQASNLLDLQYDASTDELVAVIAFRGTHPDHRFSLRWGKCTERSGKGAPYGLSALVVDAHGMDVAKENYKVTARFDLAQLECRPARVTLRFGPRVARTILVPSRAAR